MNNAYMIEIEGHHIQIEMNYNTKQTLLDMELDKYEIYGTILALGKNIIEMKNGEQAIIIDEFLHKGIVIIYDTITDAIDVVAVVNMDKIFIKNGVKVLKYGK